MTKYKSKNAIPIIFLILMASVCLITVLGKTRDYESIHGLVSPSVQLCEFPSEGAYEGSAVKVTITDTDPEDCTVTINIIDASAPWNSYHEEDLSDGESTGWIGLPRKNTRFHVQVWYNGDTCEFWGNVEWKYP